MDEQLLSSWRNGHARRSIIEFVDLTCGEHAVPLEGRVAVRQRRHLVVREADADSAGLHPSTYGGDGGCATRIA